MTAPESGQPFARVEVDEALVWSHRVMAGSHFVEAFEAGAAKDADDLAARLNAAASEVQTQNNALRLDFTVLSKSLAPIQAKADLADRMADALKHIRTCDDCVFETCLKSSHAKVLFDYNALTKAGEKGK